MSSKPPFEYIVRAHGPTVFRVCCAVVGPDDADDAWSDTFLAALKAYPDLDSDANVEAWLVTIAHRRSIDTLRARNRRPVPVENPASGRTDGTRGSDDDLGPELATALSELPDKQRRSIAYHFLADLPYKEVAEIMGGTAEAARRAASDGIRRLRSHRNHNPQSRGAPMINTSRQIAAADLSRVINLDPTRLERLTRQLASAADAEGLLDVTYRTLDTPVGELLVAATPAGVVRVAYPIEDHDAVLQQLADTVSPRLLRAPARLDAAATELDEYFAGRRQTFDLRLDWQLASEFRRLVLNHLRLELGFGRTASYASVAASIGHPTAARAVGGACAANPLPVLVPCHRVIRSNGTAGDYIGGPAAKRILLQLERG